MIKNISAICWSVSSCLFLWIFSWDQMNILPSHPTGADLLNSFITFSFLLLGGGACYHFLTEIIVTPYHINSFSLWKRLCYHLTVQMIIFFSVPLVLLFCRDELPVNYSYLSGLVYFVFAYLLGMKQAFNVHKIFKEIKQINDYPIKQIL